jgi:hypothetical protein
MKNPPTDSSFKPLKRVLLVFAAFFVGFLIFVLAVALSHQ